MEEEAVYGSDVNWKYRHSTRTAKVLQKNFLSLSLSFTLSSPRIDLVISLGQKKIRNLINVLNLKINSEISPRLLLTLCCCSGDTVAVKWKLSRCVEIALDTSQ